MQRSGKKYLPKSTAQLSPKINSGPSDFWRMLLRLLIITRVQTQQGGKVERERERERGKQAEIGRVDSESRATNSSSNTALEKRELRRRNQASVLRAPPRVLAKGTRHLSRKRGHKAVDHHRSWSMCHLNSNARSWSAPPPQPAAQEGEGVRALEPRLSSLATLE